MKQNYLIKGLLSLCLAVIVTTGFAKDIFVAATGSDKNPGTKEQPVLTLNKALSLARGAKEDAVIKFAGIVTLDKTFDLNGTQCSYLITVEGLEPDRSKNVLTKVDGRVINIHHGAHFAMKNLTVTGQNEIGAVSEFSSESNVTLTNCAFTDNKAEISMYGGAVRANNVTLTLTDCLFDGNISKKAGALSATQCRVTAKSTTFSNNQSIGDKAGAVQLEKCVSVFERCTFKNNKSNFHAGAVYISGGNFTGASLKMIDCVLIDNHAEKSGGALYYEIQNPNGDFKSEFINTIISKNSTNEIGGAMRYVGKPESVAKHSIDFINCTITGNTTKHGVADAGGLYIEGPSMKIKIHGTKIEKNLALRDGRKKYSDLRVSNYEANEHEANFSIKNSVIGRVSGADLIPEDNSAIDEYLEEE